MLLFEFWAIFLFFNFVLIMAPYPVRGRGAEGFRGQLVLHDQ